MMAEKDLVSSPGLNKYTVNEHLFTEQLPQMTKIGDMKIYN